MPIQPIQSRRLYQEIAGQLKALIDAGELSPGERLPTERELCEKLQVSRTAVREALIALELAGVVDLRTGQGVYVRAAIDAEFRIAEPPSGAFSPFEIIGSRLVIEPETAALAALNRTPGQLRAIADAFALLAGGNEAERMTGDRQFHFGIAEASGNAALLFLVQTLWEQRNTRMSSRLEELAVTAERLRTNVDEHRAILDAIKRKDSADARSAMKRHLRNAQRARLALMHDDRSRKPQSSPAAAEKGGDLPTFGRPTSTTARP